jgi:pyruvate-formate lyase-activating enzyme
MDLDNVKRISHELHIPMLARIPVIPGYNDSSENMDKTAAFMIWDLGLTLRHTFFLMTDWVNQNMKGWKLMNA